jgi:hypothetical protein
MTDSSLGKDVAAFPPRVSLRLLALGESLRGHVVFHHGTLFELVPDRLHMVWAGRFEKFLKVISQLSCLVLEIMLEG